MNINMNLNIYFINNIKLHMYVINIYVNVYIKWYKSRIFLNLCNYLYQNQVDF
jgi:hypothetical protein